ncbi:hemerythrin domain-containing protein [Nitrospira sp. Nam80]
MVLPFMSPDDSAVELLRKDHEKLKSLFRDFEAAADREKQPIVGEALMELEAHAAVEEDLFYPAILEDAPDAKANLDESLEEHHVRKLLIAELRDVGAGSERYAAKFRVLAENVTHHIKEEEAELFARARTGKLDLVALGKQIERAKASWRTMFNRRVEDGRPATDAGTTRERRRTMPPRSTRVRTAKKRAKRPTC